MKKNIILILLFYLSVLVCTSQIVELDDYTFGTRVYIDSTLNVVPEADKYILQYSLDSNFISPVTIDTLGYNFVWYKFHGYEDCDYRDSIGIPALPIKSLNLQLPSTSYGEEFEISNLQVTYKEYDIDDYYYPYQPCPNFEEDTMEFSFNVGYYSSYHESWDNFITVSEPYTAFGTTGITVNINPIVYNPVHGKIRIIKALNCTIPIHGGTLEDIPLNELVDANSLFDCPFCNVEHRWMEISLGKILVITDATYVAALNTYKQYREEVGYQVDIVTTNYIKDSLNVSTLNGSKIREFIRGRYYSTLSVKRPRYLLLVGNETQIPFSAGVGVKNNPFTDLYYGCIEKQNYQDENNLFPEMAYGRWPITNSDEVNKILDKIKAYNTRIKQLDKDTLHSFLISGIDDPSSNNKALYNYYKYRFLNEVERRIKNAGFSNVSVYKGTDYEGKTTEIQNILKNDMLNDLWCFVYSGHGTRNKLYHPLNLKVDEISNYLYQQLPPITLAFACLTEGSPINSSIGAKWLLTADAGGVLFYGSTDTSWTNTNEFLAKKIFDKLPYNNTTIGNWICNSAGSYYQSNKLSYRRIQVEKYNIFGDPSQYLFGTPRNYILMTPKYEENNYIEYSENHIILPETIESGKINVFDCVGRLVFSSKIINNTLFTPDLPCGVYIANINTKFGNYTYKFIVSPTK